MKDVYKRQIYDNRLLVKPTRAAIAYMPTASCEVPYKGAKEMFLVDDKEYLTVLFRVLYAYLPLPKPKRSNKK